MTGTFKLDVLGQLYFIHPRAAEPSEPKSRVANGSLLIRHPPLFVREKEDFSVILEVRNYPRRPSLETALNRKGTGYTRRNEHKSGLHSGVSSGYRFPGESQTAFDCSLVRNHAHTRTGSEIRLEVKFRWAPTENHISHMTEKEKKTSSIFLNRTYPDGPHAIVAKSRRGLLFPSVNRNALNIFLLHLAYLNLAPATAWLLARRS